MKTIVCDTGPLLHLKEIGMLDLLEKAGKVIIPKAIHVELLQIDPSWMEEKPSWISVGELPSGGILRSIDYLLQDSLTWGGRGYPLGTTS